MKVVNYTVYLMVRTVLLFGRFMPMAPTFFLMRTIGRIAWRFADRRRALILYNLELALGAETTAEQRENIGRESLIHILVSIGEFIHMDQMYAHIDKHFEFVGREHVQPLIDRKKGFFVFGGHFGGWMLPGAIWCAFPDLAGANMVARPLRNPYMQELIEFLAEQWRGKIITTRGTGSQIVDAAARGELIGLYMDQESRRDQGVFVNFFGRQANSHVVPGYLAWKHDIPLIPYWLIRERPGRYRVELGPPLTYELTDDRDENNRRVTQAIAAEVERMIRLHPEQWLWAHNRWRRRPDGTKVTLYEKERKRGRGKARKSGDYLSSVDQARKAREERERADEKADEKKE